MSALIGKNIPPSWANRTISLALLLLASLSQPTQAQHTPHAPPSVHVPPGVHAPPGEHAPPALLALHRRPLPSDGLTHRGWAHPLGATNGAGRPSLFFPGYGYAYVLPAKRQGRGLTAADPYGPPEGHRPLVYYRSPADAVYYSPVPLEEPPLWWRTYRAPQTAIRSGQPGQPGQPGLPGEPEMLPLPANQPAR